MDLGNTKDNINILLRTINDKQEWVNADVIDNNPHYAELLEDYQDFSYSQFIAKRTTSYCEFHYSRYNNFVLGNP